MTLLLPLHWIIAMATACQPPVPVQVDSSPSLTDARAECLTAETAYLRFLQGRETMKSKLRDKQIASDDEVAFYRFFIAITRYNLAQLQNDPAEALKQFRVAVVVREGQHDRAKRLCERGGGCDAEMDLAKRQLASARYHVAHLEGNTEEAVKQLDQIQEIARREFERERGLIGRNTGTLSEVEDANYRLIMAHYLQARLKGQEAESMQRLRELYTLTQAALARLRKLERQRAASAEEIDCALLRVLVVQQRLACAEGKPQRAKEIQKLLAGLTAQMLQRALPSAYGIEDETECLKVQAARARYHLVQAQHGILPECELLWELDGGTCIRHRRRGR
jgi:hypothetical protein